MKKQILLIVIIKLLLSVNSHAEESENNNITNQSHDRNIRNSTINKNTSNNDAINSEMAGTEENASNVSQDEKVTGFPIYEFRIKGNTLLNKTTIEAMVYRFLGTNKTIDDIEKVRALLEKAYKNQGYPAVAVSIPEQSTRNGIVTLKVVEGKIARVKVTGSKYHSLNAIKQKVPALTRGSVLYLPDVQKQLNQLNQSSPDRKITPVLKPGRYPGTVEVELKVKDNLPVHGDLEVNNRHTSTTSKSRLIGSVRYDNLYQKQHSMGVSYQISPENTDEVKVLSLTYIIPLGEQSDRLIFYGIDSNSNVSTLGNVTILGKGKIFGARLIKPLAGQSTYFKNLTMGFDFKDFEDTQQTIGINSFFPLSYWSGLFSYDTSFFGKKNIYQYNGGLVFGLPLNTSQDEFNSKRAGSKPNFIYFKIDASHKYTFGNKMEIRSRLDSQLALSPLISNEQFSIGGASTVRGYYESQVVDDSGLILSVELASPSFYKSEDINDFRGHVFFDYGKTWRQDPLPGESSGEDIYAIGTGLRFTGYQGVTAELDLASALKENGEIKKDDIRWHLSLKYRF